MNLIGIDLGGRTTGKTAVTLLESSERKFRVYTSGEIRDITALKDENFIAFINSLSPDLIGIDAPLSLPDLNSENYLYRKQDRLVKALSPFTIGEITARAVYLKSRFNAKCVEVYPKSVLRFLTLPETRYKNDLRKLREITDIVIDRYSLSGEEFELTGDNVDSLLAVIPLLHFTMGKYKNIGDEVDFFLPE